MLVTDALIREIRLALPNAALLENEPMSRHCSFRIGGPVRLMALPSCAEDASALLRLLHGAGVRPLVMGNGTNLLVTDGALDAVALKLGEGMARIRPCGGAGLRAGAGIPLARLAQAALTYSLAGLEFAHGIPGTLGGAVCMNAGAYGGEMRDVVTEVSGVGLAGESFTKTASELDFSYRHSVFSGTDDIVLEASVSLAPGSAAGIQARMRSLAERRRASQPLDLPSAGSTFKRPAGGYAAALIDAAGLRGFSIGGAQVSEKHAGFVVNRGGASFDDVLRLMEHIQETVLASSGILLEPEVKIIR